MRPPLTPPHGGARPGEQGIAHAGATKVNDLGHLLGRPDLTDEAIGLAVAERLAMDGRKSPDPEIVLEAARLRKRKAVAFLRQLVLPPPVGPLEMPVRPILRSHMADVSGG